MCHTYNLCSTMLCLCRSNKGQPLEPCFCAQPVCIYLSEGERKAKLGLPKVSEDSAEEAQDPRDQQMSC